MIESAPTATKDDYAFCKEVLPAVSRTFALSIEMLPESMREAVRVAYLLCRIVDTIEDEDPANIAMSARHELFDLFDAALTDDTYPVTALDGPCQAANLGAGSTDEQLCARSSASLRVFRALSPDQRDAIRPHVLEMSRGMREYAQRANDEGELRLGDMADLERYCYFVAGTVGELLTALFELDVAVDDATRAHVREHAVAFGLGLQFVNIVKDVATDAERGACFLPTALAERHGITLETILEPGVRDRALAVVHTVCARAREHLNRAIEYTLAWPEKEGANVRLFCAVPLLLALATLHEVENGEDTLRPGFVPKVSRQLVFETLQAAQAAVGSNDELRQLCERYQ